MSQAQHVVNADDDHVRVITWTFPAAGTATGHHRHEHDYVVVPVTGGPFRVIEADGSARVMDQEAGAPYLGRAGTEHDVVSAGDRTAVFVEIELKA